MRTSPQFRYEEGAGFVAGLVESGPLLQRGPAPSLREISKQRRVSLATALQAYQLLEDRGVLEARPQSGHYVAKRNDIPLATPAISNPPKGATAVAISGIVVNLLQHAADPRLVP